MARHFSKEATFKLKTTIMWGTQSRQGRTPRAFLNRLVTWIKSCPPCAGEPMAPLGQLPPAFVRPHLPQWVCSTPRDLARPWGRPASRTLSQIISDEWKLSPNL